jgi:hypothetical protein
LHAALQNIQSEGSASDTKDKPFTGWLVVMGGESQVLAHRLVTTKEQDELKMLLLGLKERYIRNVSSADTSLARSCPLCLCVQDMALPIVVYSDQCCVDGDFLRKIFPDILVLGVLGAAALFAHSASFR